MTPATIAEMERETAGLTFRPFAILPRQELVAEERHWRAIMQAARPGGGVNVIAARHMRRCIETLRSRRPASPPALMQEREE